MANPSQKPRNFSFFPFELSALSARFCRAESLIMAAAVFPISSPIANPNPNSPRCGYKPPLTFSRLSLASRRPKLGVLWASRLNFGRGGLPLCDRRIPRGFAVFASDESVRSFSLFFWFEFWWRFLECIVMLEFVEWILCLSGTNIRSYKFA